MRILIFAPNAGASLSTGGGVNFVLKQAETLASLGHAVTLAGFHALPRETLEQGHAICLPPAVRVLSGSTVTGYGALRAVPIKLSAYDALLHPYFSRWINTVFEHVQPDAVWFHDDIPRAALPYRVGCRFHLYVHYPFIGRDPRMCPVITRTSVEQANDWVLRALSAVLLADHPFDICEGVWTNSTVTSRVVSRAWGRSGEYLPTYVLPRDGQSSSHPGPSTIVAVGAFSPGKNYTTLIEGFARARPAGWRLRIAGHERDRRYVERLRSLIRRLDVRGSVDLEISPTRDQLRDMLARADVAVQPARFEPFGLSLLEAMATGLGPVAHRGSFSGSWLDILCEGRFGQGFEGPDGLGKCLEGLTGDPAEVDRLKTQGRDRARAFDRPAFVQRFEEIHGASLGAASA